MPSQTLYLLRQSKDGATNVLTIFANLQRLLQHVEAIDGGVRCAAFVSDGRKVNLNVEWMAKPVTAEVESNASYRRTVTKLLRDHLRKPGTGLHVDKRQVASASLDQLISSIPRTMLSK
ncbi:hypothetical protein [Variibacter gotjawalensis]|uniref:hypothetical protein n=1 Tax=Variibacter gotjawalensis TaxID=1333996 RepID=UPI00102B323A|nr:hypothetical protein [Variibacter gotjawalensis]NIK47895.1 hypothetical protein [Variibacter gotjawalensis]